LRPAPSGQAPLRPGQRPPPQPQHRALARRPTRTTHHSEGKAMQNLIRHKESRGRRSTRLAALAVAAAAALAGATGIAAAEGHAAPALKAEFKHPKLNLGLLTITGTEASDTIALRLQAGEPDVLQVDVGDDGSADFSFKRKHIA